MFLSLRVALCWIVIGWGKKMQTFVFPVLPHDGKRHSVLCWHSLESVRCGKCRKKHGYVRHFPLLRRAGVGKLCFFGNLKSGKTHMQRCPPQRTFIKRFIPCRLFWCFMQCGLVLFNCGPHSVGSVRKHALSPWKSVDIPNPCAYSSLPFTSSLCCFAAQQLFGVLRSTLTYTLMLHKGSILKSKTETTPPACCRPGLTDVAYSEFGCVTLQNVHYVTIDWNLLNSAEVKCWIHLLMHIFHNKIQSVQMILLADSPS